MIAIEIIGKGFLDLQGNTGISFEFISPLFKDNIAQTGYSYPIEIPLTDNNRKLLGFLDLLDIDQDFTPYACIISYSGIQLVQGTLNINSIDSVKASCFILGYEFDVEKLDTNIRNIPLGGVRSIVPGLYAEMYEHANALINADADTSDYVFFPCMNERFYVGNENMAYTFFPSPHTYSSVVNLWDYQLQSFWQPVTPAQIILDYPTGGPYGVGSEDPKASTFVPYPFIVSILKYIASFLGGYKLTGEWVNDTAIKKLTLYNTYALDKIETIFPFFRTNLDINLSNHLPYITIADFLTAIANMFNLAINIDPKKQEVCIDRKVVLLDTSAEMTFVFDDSINISPPQNTDTSGITFKLLTDDTDTQQDKLKDLVIDERVLDDSDSFAVDDDYGDIRFGLTNYKASINGAGSFSEMPSAPTYKIGKGLTEKNIACGTLDTAKNLPIHYSYFDGINPSVLFTYLSGIIPIAKQVGNSDIYGVNEDYIFRVLFYAGMHTDPNGYGDYPIGTSNIYDDNANAILPYSLKWKGGDFALYEAWWQKWAAIYTGKIITVNLLFSIPEFINFDITKKLRIGNRLYFIQKLQIGISHNGLSKAKATCVQIPL